MTNSNKRKTKFLGMPYGTAWNRLRKSIMFSLIKELGKDICYVCSKKIETEKSLTIEHKLPWEGRSKDLFWDLTNIAFSHAKCNKRQTKTSESIRKVGPEGTNWCGKCKKFLPNNKFHKDPSRWSGLNNRCNDCRQRLRKR